jgi:hypothetical protein
VSLIRVRLILRLLPEDELAKTLLELIDPTAVMGVLCVIRLLLFA